MPRQGPPVHQNTFAFRHNPHSPKTKHILSLPNEGLCKDCHNTIEWKKKYRKYKPLTTPKRCDTCTEKTVIRAYHFLCDSCAEKLAVCAKCRKSTEIEVEFNKDKKEEAELRHLEKEYGKMSVRERNAFFRQLTKDENPKEKKPSPEKENSEKEEKSNGSDEELDEFDGDFDEEEMDNQNSMKKPANPALSKTSSRKVSNGNLQENTANKKPKSIGEKVQNKSDYEDEEGKGEEEGEEDGEVEVEKGKIERDEGEEEEEEDEEEEEYNFEEEKKRHGSQKKK